MAKLVTKFKYLKPDSSLHAGGYAKYIATREGVEKIDDSYKLKPATKKQQLLIKKILRDFPDTKGMLEYQDYLNNPNGGNASEFITRAVEDNADEMAGTKTYADYIATRPGVERYGAHGLFTRQGEIVELSKVSDELNNFKGNIWTVIISLRREDAERLSYNTGQKWRTMLRDQEQAFSDALGIPLTDLKWYGAFHNESHHPHVHLIVYSERPLDGFLTKKGVQSLRSSFAKSIFNDELSHTYSLQMEYRDTLRQEGREQIANIVAQINAGTYDNPALEEKLLTLADRLSKTDGKKVYGYLKADVKALVDSIIDELATDERIAELYNLWNERREQVLSTYTDEMPKRVPLTANKEFKPIKNAVVKEAMNIVLGKIPVDSPSEPTVSDEEPAATVLPDTPDEPVQPDSESGKRSWWTADYKWARVYLYGNRSNDVDLERAYQMMQREAQRGNGFAMFDFGRMYLAGLGCEKNEQIANRWFESSLRAFQITEPTAKKPSYLQYRIGKMYSLGYGTEQNYEEAAKWYEKAVEDKNPFAAYSLASQYLRGQGVPRDEARAYSLFEIAAEDPSKPNAYAAYELGRMCENGIGTELDTDMADYWYSGAYDGFVAIEKTQADDKLYYRLGQMNLSGTGTKVDTELARLYFEKAAKLGNQDALYGLGKLYLNKSFADYDAKSAVNHLVTAAQQGHEYAQYSLGRLFLQGIDVPKNVTYAITWLEQAAEQGNTFAQYLLGKTFLMGEEVQRDVSKAINLLRQSADNGNTISAYMLGKTFLEGKYVQQDEENGLKYLTEAADRNNTVAQFYLGKALYEGKLTGKRTKKALDYLERASQAGNSGAAYYAGKIYLSEGSWHDGAKAIQSFELAALHGNSAAEYQLGLIYLSGKIVPKDEEKAMAYLTAAASHGNQYAAQMIASMKSNRNWSAALGSIRLLHHVSRMLSNQAEEDRRVLADIMVDQKLRRKIEEKKQAQGLK